MKISRIVTTVAVFAEGTRTIDGKANGASFELDTHGVIVKRPKMASAPLVLIPWTSIGYVLLETPAEVKPVTGSTQGPAHAVKVA